MAARLDYWPASQEVEKSALRARGLPRKRCVDCIERRTPLTRAQVEGCGLDVARPERSANGSSAWRFCATALIALCATSALGGGRARYGGTLNIVAVSTSGELDPLLADTPVDAALTGLGGTPVCRLAQFSRPSPSTLHLVTDFGTEITQTLNRIRTEPSPYRALLASVKTISTSATGLELMLDGPSPSLERDLCHPAFTVPIAPYLKGLANAHHPEGRPYPDALSLQRTDARTAERLLRQRRTHLIVGASGASDAPLLFATYLVLPADPGPGLRQALEATTERSELTRYFVRPPAAPLFTLLPPTLGGSTVAPPRPPKPAVQRPAREITLTFDRSNDDHRAIAEKLQVKLQPQGFRLLFQPVSRLELRSAWASSTSALSLQTVLLPPSPAGAFAVISALTGQPSPPSLQAVSDLMTQDTLARELAASATLNVIPLCVQGVGLRAAHEVQHVTYDSLGVPRLDDVFLSSD